MRRLLAITGLTWKAAFRFRLFLVIAVLLLGAVVGLPLLIKDDGTARGFTQILLTYTLSVIATLLGLSTLWLACGTLARDIDECQIQMVAVKPVARWQIWLGKWLGIVTLNAALLAIAGTGVYALLQWRSTRLPAAEQHVLRNEVLVSRGSAKEKDYTKEIDEETEKVMEERLKQNPVAKVDRPLLRQQIREQVKASLQIVPPGGFRFWEIDLGKVGNEMKGRPLYLRVKFNAAQKSPSGTFIALWQAGSADIDRVWQSEPMSLAPDTFHEIEISSDLIDKKGVLTVGFRNVNETVLLFPLEDGMEVLYRESSFGMNYARGLGIILCWMALLAALGLASASFLSFPVAAFFSLGLLVMAMSSSTLSNVVSEGTLMGYDSEAGKAGHSVVDYVAVPVFRVLLTVVKLAKGFSPVDALSSGRSITWEELGRAFGQIVVMLGGIIGGTGIFLFHRRELAAVQSQS
jgi:hypothetical protein